MSDAPADEALMLAYAAGDLAAFGRLYERHSRPVWRFFRRSAVGPATADDLLQDTWLAVVRNAATYVPSARFTTWLYTLARSKLNDHWRAHGRLRLVTAPSASAADEAADPLASLPAPASDQPEQRALAREQALAFVAAVEALPALQREAFLLQMEGGLTLADIAAVTGAGAETVKSRLRYALDKLRAACGGQ